VVCHNHPCQIWFWLHLPRTIQWLPKCILVGLTFGLPPKSPRTVQLRSHVGCLCPRCVSWHVTYPLFAGQPALAPTAVPPPALVRPNGGAPVTARTVAPVAPVSVLQPAPIPPGIWWTGAVSCGMSHMHFAAPPALASAPPAPPGSLLPNEKVHVPPRPWAPFAKVSVLQTAAMPSGMWWYVTYLLPFCVNMLQLQGHPVRSLPACSPPGRAP
jgi:hypothetical protein